MEKTGLGKLKKRGTILHNISQLCFLRMPELWTLISCISNRRPRSARPGNSFLVSFRSLEQGSDQKMSRLASK